MDKLEEKIFDIIKEYQWEFQTESIFSSIKKDINTYLDDSNFDFRCSLVDMKTNCLIINFDNSKQLNFQLN